MIAGFALMITIYSVFQGTTPARVDHWFRRLQLVSAAMFSLNHGANDAQKTMGIMAGVLATAGYIAKEPFTIPTWVVLAAYTAIGLGTLSGGWRIIHTMGSRITKLQPVHGFAGRLPGHGPRRAGQHDPRHHRLHRRRGLDAPPVGRAMGRRGPDRLGLGADHSRGRAARRVHGLAAEGVRHPVGRPASLHD
jgi:hypothetical protein